MKDIYIIGIALMPYFLTFAYKIQDLLMLELIIQVAEELTEDVNPFRYTSDTYLRKLVLLSVL